MKQQKLKKLEKILWEFRIKHANELKKSELRAIIKAMDLLIFKIEK